MLVLPMQPQRQIAKYQEIRSLLKIIKITKQVVAADFHHSRFAHQAR